ncbi:MAG: hypothetical protein J7500_11795 [Sphingomonas sp.]|uniref:hypothetical protein n=1 Tax=Sphingomonas sp. TaxID=28214 RepID=UPI001B13E65D|nr:hypothetical protein [Sphingomonas sp.]MBO9623382.1 hypothetical protein [Sphingomonas sp.]
MSAFLFLAGMLAAESATCVFDTAPPEPCEIVFTVDRGNTRMVARGRSGKRVTFVGRRNSGWWSGTLDGAQAMGRELNRGNVVFSTRALDRSFQYWTRGNEHGSY